ncbi:MAG: FAD-dependent oxidoreductase [Burkholderiales bacterium]
MAANYDVVIVGSGAGGCAAAYHLTQTGKSVLLIERGPVLPVDGSTLDVDKVLRRGEFKCQETWMDADGAAFIPGEFANLGGKTKWYGAALLRMNPHEFGGDEAHRCLPWPINYSEIEPYYDEAERLLKVRTFAAEPDLQLIINGLQKRDARWQSRPLAIGLNPDILNSPQEARHFDGFAIPSGHKADGEAALLARVRQQPNLQILTSTEVMSLMHETGAAARINGVVCADGRKIYAAKVLLAAGALHSPRLLQSYLRQSGLSLKSAPLVGRYYKCHLNTALIALSLNSTSDVLRKTTLLLHDAFPHTSLQALGGNLAEEIIGTQLPGFVPRALGGMVGRRAYGFFATTEDGSHFDNCVTAKLNGAALPQLNYAPARLPEARTEHLRFVRTLQRALLKQGYFALARHMPLDATAHACGTLIAGRDPQTSVVDKNGKVHGMENLYVVDGSILPRSSRVNPALTIYAWSLRVASRLEIMA